jgi:hypothetical protein
MQPMHVMKEKIPPSLLLCWNQHKPPNAANTAKIAAIFFYFYLVLFSLCSMYYRGLSMGGVVNDSLWYEIGKDVVYHLDEFSMFTSCPRTFALQVFNGCLDLKLMQSHILVRQSLLTPVLNN